MAAGRTFSALALLAAVLVLSSCGRRADLDTPYDAARDARTAAREAGEPVPPEPQKPDPDKPFILDKLL